MKSITNQPNLYRTEDTYYYRKRIPSDLRDILCRSEYKKSLRGGYQTAKRKTAHLNSALDQLFDMIRLVQPTSDDIKQIIRNYFEKLLIDAEGQAWQDSEVWNGATLDISTYDAKDGEERIRLMEERFQGLKQIIRQQAFYENYSELAMRLLRNKGFETYEMSPTSAQLYRGMAEADLEAVRISIASRQGESDKMEILNPMFKGCRNYLIDPDLDLLVENEGLPYYSTEETSPSLSTAIERYIQFITGKKYAGNTLQEINTTLLLMPEIIGDKRLSKITNEDCRTFRDCIVKIPAHYGKKYRSKGIGLLEVINGKAIYDHLSPRTIDKYWQWVGSFFSWCIDEGYLAVNPLGKIKVQAVKPSINDRDPFSDQELKAFFSSPQYTGHKSDSRRTIQGDMVTKDGKYWIPLVGLFSGMRLGEIIQLLVSDIRYDGEMAYFDVNDDGDEKSLKTQQSRRIIPIHPELVRIGFINMVEKIREVKKPDSRLFGDIKIAEGRGPAHEFSKYFSRYMEGIGLKRDKLVFHSFRHNFVQGMREARIDQDRMDALDGRNTGNRGGSNTRRNYGRAFTAEDLYPDICKIAYKVDVSHLYAVKTQS